MDVAALVDRRHVSGDEEAVLAELGGGLLRLAPVAAEDVGALHLQHADRDLRQVPAILVDDAPLDPGPGEADRAGAALAAERVRGVHRRLGLAVAPEDVRTGSHTERLTGF